MKHLLKYESFKTNETLDMFMMPVDPMEGYSDVWDDFKEEFKKKFNEFVDKIKMESKETKEAFKLCVKAADKDIDLTVEERKTVWKQLGDIFKTLGLAAITIIPGDILIFMLIKFLKIEKYVFPSAFKS